MRRRLAVLVLGILILAGGFYAGKHILAAAGVAITDADQPNPGIDPGDALTQVPDQQPTLAPELQEEQEPIVPEKPTPEIMTHVVAVGDTLGGIAVKYGTDVQSLMALNKLSSANRLQVGQRLKVITVKGVVHKVASGDTLWDIARAYKVDMAVIEEANPKVNLKAMTVGTELIIPGAKPIVRTSTVTVSRGSTGSRSGTTSSLGFIWPARRKINSGFGERWGKLHGALDIGVPTGTPVRATKAGVVTYAGWAEGYGYLVKIDHGNGYESRYGHNSRVAVKKGQRVAAGTIVAYSGNTGNSTGPHLHFEVRRYGRVINPLTVLPK